MMEEKRDLDVRSWLQNVISWDGILPLTLVLISSVIKASFPNQQRVVEFSLMFLAIAAFFLRFRIGLQQIRTNQCGDWMRNVQRSIFLLSVLLLALLEFVLMLVPKEKWFAVKEDRIVWALLISLYFMGMIFSWYPGRSRAFDTHGE